MKIEKYFWSLNKKALKKVKKILRNPEHPKFVSYAFTLLSQCDIPKEVFSVIKKEHFIEYWPEIRKYWNRTGEAVRQLISKHGGILFITVFCKRKEYRKKLKQDRLQLL